MLQDDTRSLQYQVVRYNAPRLFGKRLRIYFSSIKQKLLSNVLRRNKANRDSIVYYDAKCKTGFKCNTLTRNIKQVPKVQL